MNTAPVEISARTLAQLSRIVCEHRDERDWKQFHTPKELAVSLVVEAGELLSIMQWKSGEQLDETIAARRTDLADELADVLHSLLLLSDELKIDLAEALDQKLLKDAAKYPIEKARGKNLKYSEL